METLETLETLEALLLIALIYLIKVAVVFVILIFIRPVYQNWGATPEEISQSLPGDNLVPSPKLMSTRAIDINAPAQQVWPWIVQMGYDRAGWYNYDLISRCLGMADYVDGWRSSQRIVPELQNLKVRDRLRLSKRKGYVVTDIKAHKLLILFGKGVGDLHSWVYVCVPSDNGLKTRLIVRHRNKYSGWLNKLLFECLDIGFFIMERGHLLGLKRLAEESSSCAAQL